MATLVWEGVNQVEFYVKFCSHNLRVRAVPLRSPSRRVGMACTYGALGTDRYMKSFLLNGKTNIGKENK